MLDSTKKRGHGEAVGISIVSVGTTVTGDVKSKGTVRIEGVVAGRVLSDDTILVQETGRVKGELAAAKIVIAGQMDGNVFARERVEIASKAKLIGDIATPRLKMDEGVLFEGQCTMKPAGEMKFPDWLDERDGARKERTEAPAATIPSKATP